jgi:hypothetical protein
MQLPGRVDEFALQLGRVLIPQFLSGQVFDWLRRLTALLSAVGIMQFDIYELWGGISIGPTKGEPFGQ